MNFENSKFHTFFILKKLKKIYVRIKRLSNFWFILKTLFFAVFQKKKVYETPPNLP
jgi:hypothetical protein